MTKSKIQLIIIGLLLIFFVVLAFFLFKDDKNSEQKEYKQYENKYDKKIEVISDKNEDGTYNLNFNNNKWKYDKEHDVYYQIGIAYCSVPENDDYQCLSIYVSGKYLNGNENQDGTYSCTKNNEAQVGIYNVNNAPIVMPINMAGYTAQKSTTFYDYTGLKEYLDAGLIYVYPGCRGLSEGGIKINGVAPWGVTDLKAAIRYLRYNSDVLVGNTNKIFMFGHGEGGGLSAIVGASGNNNLYVPYLKDIGAALTDKSGKNLSDELNGVMCWCPSIINEMSNAAYEWNIGQYASVNSREKGVFTKNLSNDLAKEYAKYINNLNLRDNNKPLQLVESEDGIYIQGSYYDYVKVVIEDALNDFIHDTKFPSIIEITSQDEGDFPGGNKRKKSVVSKKTQKYNSIKEYLDSLNKTNKWVEYDENTNSAIITSIKDFVLNCKKVNKDVGGFDSLGKNQIENRLFGTNDDRSVHYDHIMSNLLNTKAEEYSKLKKWSKTYPSAYAEDIVKVDTLKNDVSTRVKMYNPMFYLTSNSGEDNTSSVAKYWRINTGINQSNTSNVSEINLYLLLKANKNVAKVDYSTVWGQEHSMAEKADKPIQNFIEWINSCN